MKAMLPHDEALGDMLRDGEEIFVILRGDDGQRPPSPPTLLKQSITWKVTT